MRKYTIKKGWRRPLWSLQYPILVRKNKNIKFTKKFTFTESCLYKINGKVPTFLNKLFGFSPSFGIRKHHNQSWRFGWKPSWDLKQIDIFTYEYRNGILIMEHLKSVDIGTEYTYTISYDWSRKVLRWEIEIDNISWVSEREVDLDITISIGYTLGIYFGGKNKPRSPHDIVIYKG